MSKRADSHARLMTMLKYSPWVRLIISSGGEPSTSGATPTEAEQMASDPSEIQVPEVPSFEQHMREVPQYRNLHEWTPYRNQNGVPWESPGPPGGWPEERACFPEDYFRLL